MADNHTEESETDENDYSDIKNGFNKLLKDCDVKLSERHFISTLTFLREGASFRLLTRVLNLSSRTITNDVWRTLGVMEDFDIGVRIGDKNKKGNEVLDLVHGDGSIITMAIDTMFCPISLKNNDTFNKKYNSKGVKYQFGVGLKDGKILYASGPFNARISDINIYRQDLINRPRKDNERYVADKAYVGEPSLLVAKKKNQGVDDPLKRRIENSFIKTNRIIVENTNSHIRQFKFNSQKWKSSILNHQLAMKFIIFLYNISVDISNDDKIEYFKMLDDINKLEQQNYTTQLDNEDDSLDDNDVLDDIDMIIAGQPQLAITNNPNQSIENTILLASLKKNLDSLQTQTNKKKLKTTNENGNDIMQFNPMELETFLNEYNNKTYNNTNNNNNNNNNNNKHKNDNNPIQFDPVELQTFLIDYNKNHDF
ncbi:hypothetical protein ACTFIZ_004231 [Dictyostelium cf. discoideum]